MENIEEPCKLANAILLASEMRENSWNGTSYVRSIETASALACTKVFGSLTYATLINIMLTSTWNEAIEWADRTIAKLKFKMADPTLIAELVKTANTLHEASWEGDEHKLEGTYTKTWYQCCGESCHVHSISSMKEKFQNLLFVMFNDPIKAMMWAESFNKNHIDLEDHTDRN